MCACPTSVISPISKTRAPSTRRSELSSPLIEAPMTVDVQSLPRERKARQGALIEIVRRLGRERFAPRAAKYDREASFPFENYEDLRTHGLLGLCVPEKFGGLGADFETYCLVSAE